MGHYTKKVEDDHGDEHEIDLFYGIDHMGGGVYTVYIVSANYENGVPFPITDEQREAWEVEIFEDLNAQDPGYDENEQDRRMEGDIE